MLIRGTILLETASTSTATSIAASEISNSPRHPTHRPIQKVPAVSYQTYAYNDDTVSFAKPFCYDALYRQKRQLVTKVMVLQGLKVGVKVQHAHVVGLRADVGDAAAGGVCFWIAQLGAMLEYSEVFLRLLSVAMVALGLKKDETGLNVMG